MKDYQVFSEISFQSGCSSLQGLDLILRVRDSHSIEDSAHAERTRKTRPC
jgi:hypothetical protein